MFQWEPLITNLSLSASELKQKDRLDLNTIISLKFDQSEIAAILSEINLGPIEKNL